MSTGALHWTYPGTADPRPQTYTTFLHYPFQHYAVFYNYISEVVCPYNFLTKILYAFLFLSINCARPANLIRNDLIIMVLFDVTLYVPSPYYAIFIILPLHFPLRYKYSPRHSILKYSLIPGRIRDNASYL
jgi:hypothetical protein